jgi:hypothetical protein
MQELHHPFLYCLCLGAWLFSPVYPGWVFETWAAWKVQSNYSRSRQLSVLKKLKKQKTGFPFRMNCGRANRLRSFGATFI